jgi:hypothetical protein
MTEIAMLAFIFAIGLVCMAVAYLSAERAT